MAERKGASTSSGPQGPEKRNPASTRRYQELSGFSLGLSLAFEFAAAVALFWFLGWLVDGWLDIEPWGQVVGGVIGWFGGTYHVYLASQRRFED